MIEQNETLARKATEIAASKLGQKEATGRNDGPFVLMLQRFVARGAKWLDGQPWCACFVTWCIYEAAQELNVQPQVVITASAITLGAFGKRNALMLDAPVANCIGLLKDKYGNYEHTFFVEDVSLSRGRVIGIDGNWSNAVSRTHHLISACDFMMIT